MHKSKCLGALVAVAGTMFLSGCSGSFKAYPHSMVDTALRLDSLKRDQYVILADVEGRAEGSVLFHFFEFPLNNKKTFTGSMGNEGPKGGIGEMVMKMQGQGGAGMSAGMSKIEQAALYNAMESQPDADGIVALRIIKGEYLVIPGLFKKASVTIKGKAIKIKKD